MRAHYNIIEIYLLNIDAVRAIVKNSAMYGIKNMSPLPHDVGRVGGRVCCVSLHWKFPSEEICAPRRVSEV